jgi:hypothetical protein
MSFKLHLIIISFIITAVYLAWRLMDSSPASVPAVAPSKESPYSITISHASWGLNCRYKTRNNESDNFAGAKDSSPLREDNVLAKISQECNGKLHCSIPVSTDMLGPDPAAQCYEKELSIEYRCFSYDRPWHAKASSGTLTIDCNK